jgi:hypothetical protein
MEMSFFIIGYGARFPPNRINSPPMGGAVKWAVKWRADPLDAPAAPRYTEPDAPMAAEACTN